MRNNKTKLDNKCFLNLSISVSIVLAALVLVSLSQFRGSLSRIFGRAFGRWHLFLTLSQLHFMFYISRPLPNVFALIFALQALHHGLENRPFPFILFSEISVLIFRGELALLLGVRG
jgi:alpha-1,6-mannosyltransferase